MVNPFSVTRDFPTHYTRCVGIVAGAIDSADGSLVDPLNLYGAGARAVVGAGGVHSLQCGGAGHGRNSGWGDRKPGPVGAWQGRSVGILSAPCD